MIETAQEFRQLTAVEILRMMHGRDRHEDPPKKKKRSNGRVRFRFVGMGGEMRIGGRPCVNTKTAFRTNLGTVRVSYAKIITAEQAAHANRLNRQLYAMPSVGPGS